MKIEECIYQFEVIERAEEGDEPADDPHEEAGPHRPGVGEDAARRDEDARAFVDRLKRTIFNSFIFTFVLVIRFLVVKFEPVSASALEVEVARQSCY